MSDYLDDRLDDESSGSVVRWMGRPPMHLSPAALSGAVAGAFVLGLAAAVGLMALTSRFTHNRTSRRLR